MNAKWLLAVAAAALLLMVGAGVALLKRKAEPTVPVATPVAAASVDAGCVVPPEVQFTTVTDEASAPVLLWAVSPVRLFIDDKPAFSPPEKPLRFSGEHTLRAEAAGEDPLVTRFRIEPHVPALFHAEVDGMNGITLVRLGAVCASCSFPQVDVKLDYVKSADKPDELVQAAAMALRTDNWNSALVRLQRVPKAKRSDPVFLRLAANIYQAARRPDDAEGAAKMIPKARSNDLAELLTAYAKLKDAEGKAKGQVLLERWNKLTERFGALAAKFAEAAPGPISSSTRRLEQLSNAFTQQLEDKDERAQATTVEAAEQTVLQAVREVRSARPGDCAFQVDVVATVTK